MMSMVMMSMVRHGLITFVNVLVLGVAISVTILTDNLDNPPYGKLEIKSSCRRDLKKFTLPSVNET